MTLNELLKAYDNNNAHLIVRNRNNTITLADTYALSEMSPLMDKKVQNFHVSGDAVDDENVVCHYTLFVMLDVDNVETADSNNNGFDILDGFGLN